MHLLLGILLPYEYHLALNLLCLYILLMIVLESITSNYTVFLFVFSLPLCVGLAILVKKESEDYFLTTLLLCVLGIVYFCMAGLRQAIAIGFCLISYKFVKERKLIPFLICILLAYGFHNSSLVFILAYPLYKSKTNSFYFVFVAICFILGYIKSGIINSLGFLLTKDSAFEVYFNEKSGGLNYTAYIIQLAMTVFCFLYKEKICEENENAGFLFNMSLIGLCVQGFAGVVSEFFRLSMYFSIFLAVLVPKAIMAEKNDQVKWLEFFIIIAVCFYYIFFLNDEAASYMMLWSK